MADIRIKDLTTTASSTASDDFIAVDGTTNGTRKLSAFNPTFGGNATVTGTLTVNSTFASTSSGTTLTSQFSNTLTGAINVLNLQLRRGDSANGFSRLMWNTGSTTEWSFGSRAGDTNLYVWDEVANAERLKIASSTGNVSIASTTASTSTSTGALVVGNGTSGGLGVGGAINAGVGTHTFGTSAGGGVNSFGSLLTFLNIRSTSDSDNPTFRVYDSRVNVSAFDVNARTGAATVAGTLTTGNFTKVSNLSVANGSEYGAFRSEIGNDGTLGALLVDVGGLPSATGSTRYGFISAGDNGAWRKFYVGGRPSGGGQVLIPATDISSSTSTGALVVSGGVGVAGDVTSGGNGKFGSWTRTSSLLCLNTFGGSSGVNIFRQNLASDPGTLSAGDRFFLYVSDATEGLRIGTDGSNSLFKLTTAGAMTLASSIQTSAPSGGTAAAWKLGTVASVSPTSPNRTIEVDIGGTIYYIHAKTTNN